MTYYRKLDHVSSGDGAAIEKVVREAMEVSISIWKKIHSSAPE